MCRKWVRHNRSTESRPDIVVSVANCKHNWFGLQSSRFFDPELIATIDRVKTEVIGFIRTKVQNPPQDYVGFLTRMIPCLARSLLGCMLPPTTYHRWACTRPASNRMHWRYLQPGCGTSRECAHVWVYRHKRIESYIGFEHVFLSLGLGGTPSQSKLLYGVCSGSVMHRTLAPRQDGAMHQVSFAFIKGFT